MAKTSYMQKDKRPCPINCPQCQADVSPRQIQPGKKIVCRECGNSFHLLPDSQSEDTVISSSITGGEALAAVGRLWLDLRPGQIVAEKYLVIRILGHGGLSRIFQVRDLGSQKILALKLPLASTVERLPVRALFEEATAWLKPAPHPNLVTCEEVLLVMGLPAIVMEYVSGGDLSLLMEQGEGAFYQAGSDAVASKIMDLFIQITRGLAYAHSLGLSQLDIKPRNILLGEEGRALISDYGPLSNIAKAASREKSSESTKLLRPPPDEAGGGEQLISHSRLMGTYQYFSPERALGLPCSGIAADLWAASLTALECFLGRRLWEMGSTAGQALDYLLDNPKPEPRIPIPEPMADFFKKALAADPERRHQSAGEMEEELTIIFQDISGGPYNRAAAKIKAEQPERLKMKIRILKEMKKESMKDGR